MKPGGLAAPMAAGAAPCLCVPRGGGRGGTTKASTNNAIEGPVKSWHLRLIRFCSTGITCRMSGRGQTSVDSDLKS
eukprot:s4278_g5.t1